MPKPLIDLHLHTLYSDGVSTPEQVAEEAQKMNLAAIALTDHDTIEGCARLAKACSERDIEFIPGTELSTDIEGHEMHLLGYYLDTGNDRQKAMARRFINERTLDATQRYIDIAESIGHSVTTMATAWSKQHDFVGSTIVGATSVEQLEECLLGADLVLNDETMDLLDDVEEALPNSFAEDGLRKL